MRPTKFKVICNDDLQEYEDQVNQALAEGFSFIGDAINRDNLIIREMVLVEPITPVAIPGVKLEDKKEKN